MEIKEAILLKHLKEASGQQNEDVPLPHFFYDRDAKAILSAMDEFATQNKNKLNEIFLWLLGYSDFPQKETHRY